MNIFMKRGAIQKEICNTELKQLKLVKRFVHLINKRLLYSTNNTVWQETIRTTDLFNF